MSNHEKALNLIKSFDDPVDAAEELLKRKDATALYVMIIGVESIKSKDRRSTRRRLKAEIRPTYVKGKVSGSIKYSKKTVEKMLNLGNELWAEWKIGALLLADMTREQLLAQIENEKASAHGSMQNVYFYSAMVEPLKAGQLVRDYWTPDSVSKLKKQVWKNTEKMQPALENVA